MDIDLSEFRHENITNMRNSFYGIDLKEEVFYREEVQCVSSETPNKESDHKKISHWESVEKFFGGD